MRLAVGGWRVESGPECTAGVKSSQVKSSRSGSATGDRDWGGRGSVLVAGLGTGNTRMESVTVTRFWARASKRLIR